MDVQCFINMLFVTSVYKASCLGSRGFMLHVFFVFYSASLTTKWLYKLFTAGCVLPNAALCNWIEDRVSPNVQITQKRRIVYSILYFRLCFQ